MPREDVVEFPAVGEALCVHNLFQSNMVLQRDKPIPIWGWANPGEKVNVSFGGKTQGASRRGKIEHGRSRCPAMAANAEPQTLTVKGKDKTLTLENMS